MDFLSKILAILFTALTFLGIMPSSVPKTVTLESISTPVTASTEHFDFSNADGKFSLALD